MDYQIEDNKEQLNYANINYERKNDIDTQISNREYAKKKISEKRDEYYKTRNINKSYSKSDKEEFDL